MAINQNVMRVRQAQKDQDRAENLLLSIPPHAVWTRREKTKENISKTKKVWQCIMWSIFDIQTSYVGLKVSEFNQDSISEV